jgi:hypothetical protein
LLHTHPSIYYTHCKMFFSQYFSFPQSGSYHHWSTHIHPPTTMYNFSPTFPLSVSFHHCYIRIPPAISHTV